MRRAKFLQNQEVPIIKLSIVWNVFKRYQFLEKFLAMLHFGQNMIYYYKYYNIWLLYIIVRTDLIANMKNKEAYCTVKST